MYDVQLLTVIEMFRRRFKNATDATPRHATPVTVCIANCELQTALQRSTLMMPSQTQFAAPLAGTPRPPLPLEHLNPHIKTR